MIKQWKVFNFKSVRTETELELAPLTIFAGANSTGKSTLLQSMLIVAQTLGHKVSSRSVVLNGALARLGQFDDLKSADSDANQIVIGWVCQPDRDVARSGGEAAPFQRSSPFFSRRERTLTSVSCDVAFDTQDTGEQREVTQVRPRLFSTILTAVMRDPDGGDTKCSMSIRRASNSDFADKRKWIEAVPEFAPGQARDSLDYQVDLDGDSLAELHDELPSAEPVGCTVRHFLPHRLSIGVDLPTETARAIVATVAGDNPRGAFRPRAAFRTSLVDRGTLVPSRAVDFIFNVLANYASVDQVESFREHCNRPSHDNASGVALDLFLEQLRRLPRTLRVELRSALADSAEFDDLVATSIRAGEIEDAAVLHYRLPAGIAEAGRYLDDFFARSVRYLGPLRDEPKSLYPLAPVADPADIGLKGEHTAAVLDLHKNLAIRYVPSTAFGDEEVEPTVVTRTLRTAVIDWLRYLGVADNVESQDKGKFGHELTVSVPHGGRPQDLTHVGVGVSQVLPILVASLLADSDTTLIFEQPELHLHPKVQTLLGDFFLSMTRVGKQCIIESHSEYIVNRLRRRVAASTSDSWAESVKIYFVEKDQRGSSFREVAMNEYGAIADWPEGFFDQSQREAEEILRGATKKRRARRERER